MNVWFVVVIQETHFKIERIEAFYLESVWEENAETSNI